MEPTRINRPACIVLALIAGVATAQTPPTDELVQDLRNQLKAAQDRKNVLATENTKLREQIADQQKKLTEQADRFDAMQNRAYFLREHYAAWAEFLDINPSVRGMWASFAGTVDAVDRAADLLGDGHWPFSVEG